MLDWLPYDGSMIFFGLRGFLYLTDIILTVTCSIGHDQEGRQSKNSSYGDQKFSW